jgi:hypothetical protein
MRRLTAFALAGALGIATALGLVSCGGDDAQLLPGDTAGEITENLDTVKRLASEGECVGAEDAAEQVSSQVEALGGVDEKLKQALQQGAVRLNEVVATCEEATTEAVAPASVPTTEETTKEPPGQDKKEEKEREKEEKAAEKEAEKEESETGPPAEVPPPNSNGHGKEPEDEEEPSGGISPGETAGGGD